MSKENTAKFLDEVGSNDSLKKTLLDSNAQAWVSKAKSSGYDITVDELADELIGFIRRTTSGELNDGSLDAVTGGAGVPARQVVGATPVTANAALKGAQLAPVGINPNVLKKGAARW